MRKLLNTIYLAGIVAEVVIRKPYVTTHRQGKMTVERYDAREQSVLAAVALGMLVLPLAYMVTPWLKWADYRWSRRAQRWAGAAGTAVLGVALWLFWRSHADLGSNWSPTLQIRQDHSLVTRGIYGSIRHPMYASQFFLGIAQALLIHNWLAGWAGFMTFLVLYGIRVPHEEQMMLEQFGEQYRDYMTRTGRIFPRV